MSQTYAAAFGYQVYIEPVTTANVDVAAVTGGVAETGFIALGASNANVVDPTATIEAGATDASILADGSDELVDAGKVIRLYGLTNAALETDTGSETVTTYDTESKGFDQNIAVSKSWSLSLEGVSNFNDAGYKALRLLEANAVAGSLKCKIGRIGPTGTAEAVYGYVTLTGFSESVEAGSIVSYSVEAQGYGPYALDLDNAQLTQGGGDTPPTAGPVDSFTLTDGGSGYAEGSYTTVALTGGNGTGATADITVDALGEVTAVDNLAGGADYEVGDTLSADPSFDSVGSGSGFEITVDTIA